MALVLQAKQNFAGDVKRFNVVRAENGSLDTILEDIPEGEYSVLENNIVTKVRVGYRTVQDIDFLP